jgi:hypothetical protein
MSFRTNIAFEQTYVIYYSSKHCFLSILLANVILCILLANSVLCIPLANVIYCILLTTLVLTRVALQFKITNV